MSPILKDEMDAKLFSRRDFLTLSISAIFGTSIASGAGAPITVGAIRWDSWYDGSGSAAFAQRNLSSPRFQYRAPLHCDTGSEFHFGCIGNQSVIDAEIEAASRGGLDFWAFDWFPPKSAFRKAWSLYQSSAQRHRVKWCGIVAFGALGSAPFATGDWKRTIEVWADYMAQSFYQRLTVAGETERPLLFIFYREAELKTYFDGDHRNVGLVLNELREAAARRGVGRPYVVSLNPNLPKSSFEQMQIDAVSSYIAQVTPKEGGSFVDLSEQVQVYWNKLAKIGIDVIPIAQVGWDVRPRIERPVPWESHRDQKSYYMIATPHEFEQHLREARLYIERNTDVCRSRVLLIYSWNECDEGGCIMPTRGHPEGQYLSALSRSIRK